MIFFLNIQLITQDLVVDHGSYARLLLKLRRRKERKKEERKKKKNRRPSNYFVIVEKKRRKMPSWKQNMPGLNLRKVRISLREYCLGFYNC